MQELSRIIPRQQKRHAVLTEKQAVHIFENRTAPAPALARQYGVSVKAIRDIWIGRTWARETKNTWENGKGGA